MYLFGTAKFLNLYIPKHPKVRDVIRHIMTSYMKDTFLSSSDPLLYPLNPEAYELRLIDEDSSKGYTPYYGVGALGIHERLGSHESLAFVQVKNYRPPQPVANGEAVVD